MATVDLTVVENSAESGNAELGNGVWARDPLGATAWFHPIASGIGGGEGWATGVIGDVVLTNECRGDDPTAPYGCGDRWHIALDLDTGGLLWERQGFVGVGPAGDGAALIADDAGWSLIEPRTGAVLQELEGPFMNECCGLDTFIWTGSDGGVVWAVEYETIRIYYPELVSVPTVEVDLSR
jgi:hypothetical protein